MHHLGRLARVAPIALMLLAIAHPVAASAPSISSLVQVRTNVPYFAGPCPGGYVVRFSATIDRRDIRFHDAAGVLIMERRHVDFTGTLSNSESGKSLPYAGHFTRTHDAVAGTITVTGLFRSTVVAGEGLIALDAGRAVRDAAANELLFEAGQHAYDAMLCELLA
jgi:hypothetical protein